MGFDSGDGRHDKHHHEIRETPPPQRIEQENRRDNEHALPEIPQDDQPLRHYRRPLFAGDGLTALRKKDESSRKAKDQGTHGSDYPSDPVHGNQPNALLISVEERKELLGGGDTTRLPSRTEGIVPLSMLAVMARGSALTAAAAAVRVMTSLRAKQSAWTCAPPHGSWMRPERSCRDPGISKIENGDRRVTRTTSPPSSKLCAPPRLCFSLRQRTLSFGQQKRLLI